MSSRSRGNVRKPSGAATAITQKRKQAHVHVYEQAQLLYWSKVFLMLSTSALTLTTPYQETMNRDCNSDCYSAVQSTKAFVSLFSAAFFAICCEIIRPDQVVMVIAAMNLVANAFSLVNVSSSSVIALSIFSTSSSNISYVQMKANFSRIWLSSNLSDSEKANVFGQLSSTLSMSSILGPLVGSYLISSYKDTLCVACGICVVCIGAAYQMSRQSDLIFAMPTTSPLNLQSKTVEEFGQSIRNLLCSPQFILLLSLKFFMVFAYGLFLPVWRDILLHRFEFSPQHHTLYLVVTAIANAVCQSLLSGKVIDFSGPNQDYVLVVCGVCLSIGRIVVVSSHSIVVLIVVIVVLMVALVTTNTLLSIACTNLGQSKCVASAYGLLDFIENFASLLSPLLGIYLLKKDVVYPLLGVCLMYLCFCVLVLRFFRKYFNTNSEDERITRSFRRKKRARSPTSVVALRQSERNRLQVNEKHH
jgi:hypothetical protein